MQIKQCPKCTYPMNRIILDKTHYTIICTNRRCNYQVIRRINAKRK